MNWKTRQVGPGALPVAHPSHPPFSARVARPPGGGQGGLGFPAVPPTDPHVFPPCPSSVAHPRRPQPPQLLHSASNQRPSAPVHQSRDRSSCVCPTHEHASFDTFRFTFHHHQTLVDAAVAPVPPATSPPQRTLCAGSFVSNRFVSRAPSLHYLHAYTAFHLHSP